MVAGSPALGQEEKPRFEQTVVVTATPRAGSPSEYIMHFSSPVQVPGMTLPSGAYLFRFPSGSSRVIQVLKADRSNEYAMFHTINVVDVTRGQATDAHRVTFREPTAPGAPPAIREWFVPGRAAGWEFLYPTKR
jgi:hypothetical protein